MSVENRRILVVEAEASRGQVLVEMLDDRGRDCVVIDSAALALRDLALGDFALVLTTARLPTIDGLELMREIDKLDPDLPVILVADDDQREAAAEAVRARAFDVLWRPLDPAKLRDAVERGLESRATKLAARKLALDRRRRLERRSALLSVLFEQGSDGVLTWDARGKLVDVSPSVLALTGASLDEILSAGSTALFEPEPFGGSFEDRITAAAREPGNHRQEVVVRTNDGPAPARLTLTVVELEPSEEGERPVRWVMGVLLPPRREDLRERVRRADRLAGAAMVSAGAAHEIKNDLTPLLTCISLLEDTDAITGDLVDVVREAKRCVRRIESGVDRILAPLRPQRPRRSRLDVADVIRESLTFTRRRGRERRPRIVLAIADDLPPVLARPDDLHQIVNNLVTNAFEAIAGDLPPTGDPAGIDAEIHVELDRDLDTNELVLTVHDSGPGIDPHCRARVFEPFYTTKGPYGTGLGLTVVRDLVRELGGELSIESVPTITGTRVHVRLPAASC